MNELDYGISTIKVGDDDVDSKVVKFGDGLTRIATCGWGNNLAGVQLCRSDLLSDQPFIKFKAGDDYDPNGLYFDEKVYLVFDDAR